MKNWKQKMLLAMLFLVLAFALASCTNSDNGDETVPVALHVADNPTVSFEENTAAPTEEVAYVQHEEATSEKDEPTEKVYVEEPTVEAPIEAVDETPVASAGTLSGTFVLEDEAFDGLALEFFTNGTFNMIMSFNSLEMGFYIPGHISIGGTFDVDEAAQIIALSVEEENIIELVLEILNVVANYMMKEIIADEFGDEFSALAEDEDFMEGFMQMVLAMMDHMFDEMFEEMFEEMASGLEETLIFTFYGNFDRLYSHYDGTVLVRQ